MNEFKFQITTLALVIILAFGGYWAFTSLDKGITYSKEDSIEKKDEAFIDKEIEQSSIETPATIIEELIAPEVTSEIKTDLSEDNLQIKAELEELITDNIFMKLKSRGTRVGTVQKFLNFYLDEQSDVDNQYGPGTLKRVKQFQGENDLTDDGLAGPETYQKMIDVLERG